MRAWRLSDAFGIDRLELEERPDPPLGPGETRVRVRAVSLNYRDVAMVDRGISPRGVQLPFDPCSDAAGEVVEVGPGVSRVRVGDRVATTVFRRWLDGDSLQPAAYGSVLDGALADSVVVHEDALVHVPPYSRPRSGRARPRTANSR